MTENHQYGHRKRLRERLLKSGEDAMADYELLEMVLFWSHPRGDTKPIAKALLKKFGTLANIFAASNEDLKKVTGVGESTVAVLRLTHAMTLRLSKAELLERPLLMNSDQLIRYCRLKIKDPKVEQFHIFFLDKKHQFLADEIHQVGTVDHAAVYPREIIKKALEHGSSKILMVHNHPSGDATPSKADIDLTRHIAEIGEKLGIQVNDHLVLGNGVYTSMKAKELF
jgi:DNA repair protein RadC